MSEIVLLSKNHASNVLNKPSDKKELKEIFFKNHKKISISTYPLQQFTILASVSDDNNLYLWDYSTKELITFKHHIQNPTVCKFSPDGKYLAVGFSNGDLLVYEPKVSKSPNNNLYKIDLNQNYKFDDKNIKTAVLSVEFSHKTGEGDL